MLTRIVLSAIIGIMVGVAGQAQKNAPEDPLQKHLISPELVMQNQNAIDLTDQQRRTIVGEMTDAQATFMEYHWDLQNEVQKLAELLAKVEIDEKMALQQLSHVLEREIKIKKAQMGLMIRIKNHLTEKQQLILQGIKSKERKK